MKSGPRLNRTCARRRAVVLLGAGLLACPVVTRATTYTWNGSTTSGFGYLSENDNWVNDVAPPTNYTSGTTDLVFGSINTHGYTPTLGSSYNISSLTFNSSALAFTINGGPLTINGNNSFGVIDSSSNAEVLSGNSGIVLGASQTWNIAAGPLTVSDKSSRSRPPT